MSKPTTPSYPPLKAVQKYGNTYPKLWNNIDRLINASRSGEIEVQWDFDLCYCPIAAAIGALSMEMPEFEASGKASFAAALASWRRGKLIYQFDETLGNEIIQTATDLVIPIDIIQQLPAPCVFIGFPEPEYESDIELPAGFFVYIEHDVNTGRKELRIYYITHSGNPMTQYIIHLIPGGTINDGIDAAIKEIRRQQRQNFIFSQAANIGAEFLEKSRELTIQAVQYVLYICAENADIQENESQAKIYRKPDRTLDRLREIRKWDVGVKTGIILRAAEKHRTEKEKSNPTKEYEPRQYKNRPHIRRAHWHHFWTGSGDDKKLILRWINSTIVNADDGDIPLTIIKPEK